MIITEPEYIGGSKTFRTSLAKLYKAHRNCGVVIGIRTEASHSDFAVVQNFCAIELSLPLIPVSDLNQVPQLVFQLVQTGPGKKVNPFKFGLPKDKQTGSVDRDLIQTVQTVPGVGEQKARILLEQIPSLQKIAQADQDQLTKVIGPNSAKVVLDFFHKK